MFSKPIRAKFEMNMLTNTAHRCARLNIRMTFLTSTSISLHSGSAEFGPFGEIIRSIR